MIAIILGIIKWIGIILASILLILTGIILIISFVPIRYQIEGTYKEEPAISIRAYWILHAVSFSLLFEKDTVRAYLKTLGITIWQIPQKVKKKRKKKKNRKKRILESESSKKKVQGESILNKTEIEENKRDELDVSNKIENKNSEKTISKKVNINKEYSNHLKIEKEQNKSDNREHFQDKFKEIFHKIKIILQKIRNMFSNIEYTFRKICDRIKKITDNITYYMDLWKKDEIQSAIRTSKVTILSIWKNIKPKKLKISVRFGTEDPATLADILMVYSVLFPIIGQNVLVEPVFEQSVIEGEFFCKGKVTIYVFLIAVWQYLFDKNIKVLKESLIREEF